MLSPTTQAAQGQENLFPPQNHGNTELAPPETPSFSLPMGKMSLSVSMWLPWGHTARMTGRRGVESLFPSVHPVHRASSTLRYPFLDLFLGVHCVMDTYQTLTEVGPRFPGSWPWAYLGKSSELPFCGSSSTQTSKGREDSDGKQLLVGA